MIRNFMIRLYFLFPISIFAAVLSLISCHSETRIPGSLSRNSEIRKLLDVARDPESEPMLRYAAMEPLISQAREIGEIDWLNALLGDTIYKHPHDPYGAYYLMAMAEGARESGSMDLALDYFRRLLKNYPDLEIAGRSLHLIAMEEIAVNSNMPQEVVMMRQNMHRKFQDRINTGRNQYFLATAYGKIGKWDSMYQAYDNFLRAPETSIPGIPDARSQVAAALSFHASNKSWTVDNLEQLVGRIKYAIRTQNASQLSRYQAKDFFLMNWSQETSDAFTHIPMTLGSFLSNRIIYRGELEKFSNEREAYLWTAGWTWKIPTWYLYFRRIDYPANPEIHGRWEWGGIYFGERL